MAGLLNILGNDNESLYENVIKDGLSKRILIINQEISDDIIEDFVYYILKWNMEDKDIPVEKRKKITLLINSPGGDCISGFNLVDVIANSKTPIVAVGLGLVASMAYHLFIGCHERYGFTNTILLQHDGEISISNSSSKAKDTMRFFDSMEQRTKQHVLSHTKMTEEFYDKHYESEYYLYADEGKELGCLDKIIGIDCDLDEIFK